MLDPLAPRACPSGLHTIADGAQSLGASIPVTTRSAVGRKVVAGDRPVGDPFRVGGFRVEAAPLVLPVLAIVAAEQVPL
jgi:hypothetical protein